MSKYYSEMALRAKPYVPGLQLTGDKLIKLNTNENAYPPSPSVITAIHEEISNLQLYPSARADDLRAEIAKVNGITKEEVFVGNGSDEVLAFSFMAFFNGGKIIRFPNVTYSFYPTYAKLFDIPFEEIPVNDDLTIDPAKYFQAEGGVIFPNPNAPTSIYLELEAVERILQENPNCVVIVDEAYIDFGGESAVKFIRKYEQLLVVQTTSKSRSLAGLRVGYALGNPQLINGLIRIKDSINSYPLDRLALAGAKAAFADQADMESKTNRIIATRENTAEQLRDLGFTVVPSKTNFLFVTHEEHLAADLYEELLAKNILVRHFAKKPIENYLRISIGTAEQMAFMLAELNKILTAKA